MSTEEMLGKKVHALRTSRGLTLKELADASGLSPSFLSQIERGLTSPTVISLARIAQAFEVAPSYFFPPPRASGPAVLRYARHPFQVDDNGVFYARLGGHFSGRTMEPLLATYPPGYANERYTHAGEEFVYVVEGRVVFTVDGVEYPLATGDSIHYSAETPHHFENRSDEPVQLIYVSAPPFLTEAPDGPH